MDALIMAAGRGSRLGSHTDERPKALVDLGGTTPLGLQLELLRRVGVRRITIVTGYRRASVAAAARELAGGVELDIRWNPFWPITNVAGSAWFGLEGAEEDLVYLHGDTVFHPTILDDLLAHPGDACLPVEFRPCEPEQMKASVDGDRVTWLSKEMADEDAAGEFIGIGLFRAAALGPIRAGLAAVLDQGGFGAYFEAAINESITGGLDVRAVPTAGRPWTEIDFPEDLALARSLLPQLRLGVS